MIYKDQPIRINFNIGIDTTTTTSIILRFRKPDGIEGVFSPIGIEDSLVGDVYYDALENDIDQAGTWVLWANATTISGTFPSSPFAIDVNNEGDAIITRDFAKDWLNITTINYDTKIDSLIPLIEEDYLRIRNAPFATDSEGNTSYPPGSNVTCSEMIGYKLTPNTEFDAEAGTSGEISSEKTSKWSVSYDSGGLNQQILIHGYPTKIVGSIKKYIRGC